MSITNLHQRIPVILALALMIGWTTACSSPPLEEIAAAEKAIESARQAEAEKYAAETFNNAQKHMKDAYVANDEGEYGTAKSEAITARELAEAAEREARKRKQEEVDAKNKAAQDEENQLKTDGYSKEVQEEAIGDGATGDGIRIESLATVYFDFDRDTIREDQRDKLETAATWLQERPDTRVRLEGHTDERGEAEYNLALGERRARGVRKYLITLGIDEGRLDTVSMGEEYPADLGRTEDAFGRNRRVEFLVLKAN